MPGHQTDKAINMNRYLESFFGGTVAAYNITAAAVHANVNQWLSTVSLIIGIVAGVLTVKNLLRKK